MIKKSKIEKIFRGLLLVPALALRLLGPCEKKGVPPPVNSCACVSIEERGHGGRHRNERFFRKLFGFYQNRSILTFSISVNFVDYVI
jgi:hypothetical protein